jgi:hypothetical protein
MTSPPLELRLEGRGSVALINHCWSAIIATMRGEHLRGSTFFNLLGRVIKYTVLPLLSCVKGI